MDVRVNRIPNIILIALLVIRVVSDFFSYSATGNLSGVSEPAKHYLTIFIIFIFLFVFFSIGGIGAGDLKLICITAAGFSEPVEYVALVFLIAAVLSLIKMKRCKIFFTRLLVLKDYIYRTINLSKLTPYFETEQSTEEKRSTSLHLSIPIFIACLAFTGLKLMAV